MIEMTIEQVLAEAYQALGEAVVRERIIGAELRRLSADQGDGAEVPRP